jgi:ATP diphosphatase
MTDGVARLIQIMTQLRDPKSGCPWDRKQTYQSIVPYTIEETYEVVDAIERQDYDDLKQELGDLLFQVVFYCQIAQEQGRFDFNQVAHAVSDKLTHRHPHVFSDKEYESEDSLNQDWEKQKHRERKRKNQKASVLDDIPKSFPALMRAQKVQKRAARQGFDWPSIEGVWHKLEEELHELRQEVNRKSVNHKAVEDELGDVLFTLVNLSRHLKQDSEACLRRATDKFERRFRCMEKLIEQQGASLEALTLDEMEHFWQLAKKRLLTEGES